MNEETKTWIYALLDPIDNLPKYIGKSINPKKRYKEHIAKCNTENTKKGNWIKGLKKQGLFPVMQILKETTEANVEFWEEHYIDFYTKNGFSLKNYDSKGIGTAKVRTKETVESIKTKMSKQVYQYDLTGNLIKIHKSFRDAERETGINHGNISKCCSGEFKHTGGFIFTLEQKSDIQVIKNPNAQKKKVLQIDLDGNIIAEYISIAHASKSTNIDASNISRVCSGFKKSVKGKYFRFKNEDKT